MSRENHRRRMQLTWWSTKYTVQKMRSQIKSPLQNGRGREQSSGGNRCCLLGYGISQRTGGHRWRRRPHKPRHRRGSSPPVPLAQQGQGEGPPPKASRRPKWRPPTSDRQHDARLHCAGLWTRTGGHFPTDRGCKRSSTGRGDWTRRAFESEQKDEKGRGKKDYWGQKSRRRRPRDGLPPSLPRSRRKKASATTAPPRQAEGPQLTFIHGLWAL